MWKSMFHYVKDGCNTNLWSAANLKLYIPKTHPKSIWLSGLTIWNNLQPDARSAEAESLRNLKQLYQKNSRSVRQSYLWLHTLYILGPAKLISSFHQPDWPYFTALTLKILLSVVI